MTTTRFNTALIILLFVLVMLLGRGQEPATAQPNRNTTKGQRARIKSLEKSVEELRQRVPALEHTVQLNTGALGRRPETRFDRTLRKLETADQIAEMQRRAGTGEDEIDPILVAIVRTLATNSDKLREAVRILAGMHVELAQRVAALEAHK